MSTQDYDYVVIGSGFGGSVSALRLAQKGYRVCVVETGRRYADGEFADKTSDAPKYYWMPKLGMKGVFRMTLFKDVFVVSGSGVGGGSLGEDRAHVVDAAGVEAGERLVEYKQLGIVHQRDRELRALLVA